MPRRVLVDYYPRGMTWQGGATETSLSYQGVRRRSELKSVGEQPCGKPQGVQPLCNSSDTIATSLQRSLPQHLDDSLLSGGEPSQACSLNADRNGAESGLGGDGHT
jgi:hypothetical protein